MKFNTSTFPHFNSFSGHGEGFAEIFESVNLLSELLIIWKAL